MYTLQGAPSFIPASGFCHTPAGKETEVRRFTIAKLISEQVIPVRGRYYVSHNQLRAIESWLMRLSGGHHIAWMDFQHWCGMIPLRKVPIQMKIKSLNCSSCPWIFAFSSIACDGNACRICFKDKILSRTMFILSAVRVFFSITTWGVSVVSCTLSVIVNQHKSVWCLQVNLHRLWIWAFEGHACCTNTYIRTHFKKSFLEPPCIAELIRPPVDRMYLQPPCLVSGMSACWPGFLVICYNLAHVLSPLKNRLCLVPGGACFISPCRMGLMLSHRPATC